MDKLFENVNGNAFRSKEEGEPPVEGGVTITVTYHGYANYRSPSGWESGGGEPVNGSVTKTYPIHDQENIKDIVIAAWDDFCRKGRMNYIPSLNKFTVTFTEKDDYKTI